MSTYTQRFRFYHQYTTEMTEDFLAVTLCLPFTIALYWWNAIAPASAWNVGRQVLLGPLYFCKGLMGITVAPIVAGVAAISRERAMHRYTYRLSKGLELFNPRYAPLHLLRWLSRLALFVGLLTFYLDGPLVALQLGMLTVLPFTSFAWMVLSLGRGAGIVMGGLSLLEGTSQKISKFMSEKINSAIIFYQLWRLRRGRNTFANDQEVDTTPLLEIPRDNLFVSNSNHVFDLANLELNIGIRGFQNYYLTTPEKQVLLEAEDIIRLESRANSNNRFPSMREYIRAHKAEYLSRKARTISDESLKILEELVYALDADKNNGDQNARGFRPTLVQANEAYLQRLTTISAKEKVALEGLNVGGGYDAASNSLKNYLEVVFSGNECLKIASGRIRRAIAEIRQVGNEEAQVMFWQRPQPTRGL